MSKKSLLNTNPYLRNAAQRKEMLFQTVASSSAIEGIRVTKRMTANGRFVVKGVKSAAPAGKKKSA